MPKREAKGLTHVSRSSIRDKFALGFFASTVLVLGAAGNHNLHILEFAVVASAVAALYCGFAIAIRNYSGFAVILVGPILGALFFPFWLCLSMGGCAAGEFFD